MREQVLGFSIIILRWSTWHSHVRLCALQGNVKALIMHLRQRCPCPRLLRRRDRDLGTAPREAPEEAMKFFIPEFPRWFEPATYGS